MAAHFFVTGGTLGLDTPSYVPRAADDTLLQALAAGEVCYVLTSRQMGKSSLMVRTASGLREAGVAIAVIDLTAIGINVTAEQWYEGLTARLGSQLQLEDEIERFTTDHRQLSPLGRWLAVLERVVLQRIESNIAIFIDEIDLVRSLPFSADEFFAAIRHCYNRRAEESPWRRLTFCLLGVAIPSDLISDPHLTPFNIGRRIILTDFAVTEAEGLKQGFSVASSVADSLLARIMYWTNGHPYLTQRLCEGVAADSTVRVDADVDRVCQRLFLSPGARDHDDNLVFVRERMLRGATDLAADLDLYDRILRRRATVGLNNARAETLKLAGIVSAEHGGLRVRNRIYERVFDSTWIRDHLPDAERLRQRAAFYQGLMRAASIAAVVVLLLAGAFAVAFYQWVRVGAALELAQASEQSALREHRRALKAAVAAQDAFVREQEQRTVAVRREAEANQLREEAVRQQRASDELRKLAELREHEAQRSEQAAVESFQKMQLAYRQLLAEQRSVEERGKLFAAIPQWLQAYSADAVAQYARQQVQESHAVAALQTFAEFCELALADDDGFWVRELVRIESDRLVALSLDANVLEMRIHIQPEQISEKVLTPGISLGERIVAEGENAARPLLATLYDCRARLLFLHPAVAATNESERSQTILRCYDRALELDGSRSNFYVARAVVRFVADPTALDAVERDLRDALAQFPAAVQPPTSPDAVTPAHRNVALIQHSLANVAELQAGTKSERQLTLLDQAIRLHSEALALNPAEPRYLVSLARAHRRRTVAAEIPFSGPLRDQSIKLLQRALEREDSALVHNEWGETLLVAGDLEGSRRQFDLAVQIGALSDPPRNRYRYYCNQANAYWRPPNSTEGLLKALNAAELALPLQPNDSADAAYYCGLARWSLANRAADEKDRLRQQDQAGDDFDRCLAQDADHVGALLARCQLLFERRDQPLTDAALLTTFAAVERARQLAQSRSDQAKAKYVHGIGMLRQFMENRDERSLIKAMQSFVNAAQSSTEYTALVEGYLTRLGARTWTQPALATEASKLRATFDRLNQ